MKVLSVVHDLGHRGTQRAAQEFALGLARRGIPVAVFAHSGGGPRADILQQAGIPVWISEGDHNAALRAAQGFKADIIHIHRRGLPSIREAEVLAALTTNTSRTLETNVFGRVDRSASGRLIDIHMHLSKWTLYRWRKWAGRTWPQPALVLSYPIDTSVFRPADATQSQIFRSALDVPARAFVCGRIGKWDPALFRAFTALATARDDAYLFCVDDASDVQPAVQRFIPDPLHSRVRVLPKMLDDEQLRHFYSSLDCLLHAATIGETFGMVMAEAMACGVPVVTCARPHKDNAQCEVVGPYGFVAGSLRGMPEALFRFYELQRAGTLPFSAETVRDSIVQRYDTNRVIGRFLEVAAIALRSRDHISARGALMAAPDIVCDVAPQEARLLLAMCCTPTRPGERAAMRVIHNPTVYAAYQSARRFFRRGEY